MTVKEYLMLTSGIKEITILKGDDYLVMDASAVSILPYVDSEIDKVDLWAEVKQDKPTKIRVSIYIK